MSQMYGYAQASTRERNEERQPVAMPDFGVRDGNIFLGKLSGKDFKRLAYKWLLKK